MRLYDCSMFDGQTPVLLVSDVEFVRKALIKEFSSMPNRRVAGVSQKPVGYFLFTLNDDHWKHVRAMLSPTFTSGKLKLVRNKFKLCNSLEGYCVQLFVFTYTCR